jgi:hypothetical protein
VRFLALELDGRSTLDRTQQALYGVVIGQFAAKRQAADLRTQGPRRASVSGSVRRYFRFLSSQHRAGVA